MCVLDGATHVKVLVGLKGQNKHLLDFIFYQLRYSVWSSLLLGCVVVWNPLDRPACNLKQPDENLCAFYVKTVDSSSTTVASSLCQER